MSRVLAFCAFFAAFTMPSATAGAIPVGERTFVMQSPSARLRNADGSDRLRITVWYPADHDVRVRAILIGAPGDPIFASGASSRNAPPAAGQRPVVLLSHGYGGSARAMGWFGTALAENGYLVIAVDHPGNNGIDPMTPEGAALFFERPGDLVAAYRHVRDATEFGALIDPETVLAAGFSAGGFTALALGGGEVVPERLQAFCRQLPSDGVCRPQIEHPVAIEEIFQIIERERSAGRAVAGHIDRSLRIRAVFAMAPAIVQAFDPASLRHIAAPAAVIVGDADEVAPAETNASLAAAMIPRARLIIVPGARHYDFLGACMPRWRTRIALCETAVERTAVHSAAVAAALELFSVRADRVP